MMVRDRALLGLPPVAARGGSSNPDGPRCLAPRRTPMNKLSDTQLTTLSAAAQRPDGNLLPLPGSLRGGAATKVVGALIARGLIREVTDNHAVAFAALNTFWRNREDARGLLLLVTPAGLEALGIQPSRA